VADEETELLPAVATAIRAWIPELDGRALAVTEAEIRKDNVPTLPLAIVAPLRQVFTHNGAYRVTVVEEFVTEIWLHSVRETSADGGETPFWSYYEFNAFRNKFMSAFAGWRGPFNATVRFVSFDVEANEHAVVLTFRMSAEYQWCLDNANDPSDGVPARITFSLCAPQGTRCDPCVECDENKENEPCP